MLSALASEVSPTYYFLKKGHPTILKKQAQTNEPGLKGPLTLIGFSLHKFGVDEMVCKVREHIFIY